MSYSILAWLPCRCPCSWTQRKLFSKRWPSGTTTQTQFSHWAGRKSDWQGSKTQTQLRAIYLRLRPQDASGHYALGFVLESLPQGAAARRQFERSIALQRAQTESYFQLGMMDLDQGKLDSA